MTIGSPSLPTADTASVQRRTLWVLSTSAVFARAALSVSFVVATLLTKEILGSSTWAGSAGAALTLGAALSSSWLSSYMTKVGRRPGLVLGYGVGVVGAAIAVVGGQKLFLAVYLFGLVLFGVGQGATGLARYAAADLAGPSNRAKAIGYVVFASTVGAVGGPALSGPAARAATALGFDELVGGYLFGLALFVIAGVILFVWLRPDPLVASGGIRQTTESRPGFRDGLSATLGTPAARLALAGLVISQTVMVTVMTMTPLHMQAHDKSVAMVGWVLSSHTAGMYAFAPLAGWFADRYGRLLALAVSASVLMVATVMTAFAHDAPSILMFPGLYLLGLGWSFGMVGSSALLTESVGAEDQVAAQGAADLLKSVASGVGALCSGLVFTMAGYHILSALGLLASGLLLVAVFTHAKRGTLMDSSSLATTTSG